MISMYINNTHIMFYVVFGLLGLVVGQIVAWANIRLPEYKKIISKEFFTEWKKGIKSSYLMMFINAIVYMLLIYKFGLQDSFIKNLELIKFMILAPMLISAFFIDLKLRIIPNRLNLTIFEVGLVIIFLYGINNVNIAKDMILGMLVGGGIFVLITIVGGIISGKEAMGLGDVKLMGALGIFYGVSAIAGATLVAFFIGAIASIIILLVRNIFLYK